MAAGVFLATGGVGTGRAGVLTELEDRVTAGVGKGSCKALELTKVICMGARDEGEPRCTGPS